MATALSLPFSQTMYIYIYIYSSKNIQHLDHGVENAQLENFLQLVVLKVRGKAVAGSTGPFVGYEKQFFSPTAVSGMEMQRSEPDMHQFGLGDSGPCTHWLSWRTPFLQCPAGTCKGQED